MTTKYCQKFQRPEYGAQTLQTTDGFATTTTHMSRSHVRVKTIRPDKIHNIKGLTL